MAEYAVCLSSGQDFVRDFAVQPTPSASRAKHTAEYAVTLCLLEEILSVILL